MSATLVGIKIQPLAHAVRIDCQATQDLACCSFDVQHTEEDVARLDVIAPLAQRQPASAVQSQVGSVGERQFGGTGPGSLAGHRLSDLYPAPFQGGPASHQGSRRAAVNLADYSEEQMFRADLGVLHFPRSTVSTVERRTSSIIEAFEHYVAC
jgi:hypothetical protein